MMISINQPTEYFSKVQLNESVLVRFCVQPTQSQLDIVVNYTAETLGIYCEHLQAGGTPLNFEIQPVDFRLFRFVRVENLVTHLGMNVPESLAPKGVSKLQWAEHEKNVLLSRTRLITGAKCNSVAGGGFECSMHFASFGECKWEFQQLLVERRIANINKRGDSYEYRDSETGKIVNPKDPFADQMGPLAG